jgi:hypothetical protein
VFTQALMAIAGRRETVRVNQERYAAARARLLAGEPPPPRVVESPLNMADPAPVLEFDPIVAIEARFIADAVIAEGKRLRELSQEKP